MYPTYKDGDFLLMKNNEEFKRDNIVVFNSPTSWGAEGKRFIKRIVAIEGDSIQVNGNNVFVNGKKRELERYTCENNEINKSFTLKKNEYFVLGDNILQSNDSLNQICSGSESFFIKESMIINSGKEVFKLGGF